MSGQGLRGAAPMTPVEPTPVQVERAREGCFLCLGKATLPDPRIVLTVYDWEHRKPCPECARVVALLATERAEAVAAEREECAAICEQMAEVAHQDPERAESALARAAIHIRSAPVSSGKEEV